MQRQMRTARGRNGDDVRERDLDQEPERDFDQEPERDLDQEPERNLDQEPERDLHQEPERDRELDRERILQRYLIVERDLSLERDLDRERDYEVADFPLDEPNRRPTYDRMRRRLRIREIGRERPDRGELSGQIEDDEREDPHDHERERPRDHDREPEAAMGDLLQNGVLLQPGRNEGPNARELAELLFNAQQVGRDHAQMYPWRLNHNDDRDLDRERDADHEPERPFFPPYPPFLDHRLYLPQRQEHWLQMRELLVEFPRPRGPPFQDTPRDEERNPPIGILRVDPLDSGLAGPRSARDGRIRRIQEGLAQDEDNFIRHMNQGWPPRQDPVPAPCPRSSPPRARSSPPPSEVMTAPSEPGRTTAAQCLILVVDECEGRALEGYVLFAQDEQIAFPSVCRLFNANGLQILVNGDSYPTLEAAVAVGRVEVIEMLVTEGTLGPSGAVTPEPRAYVENHNRRWVDKLLDLNEIVQYEAEFCCFHEIRSAVDRDNLEPLSNMLARGPDIRHRYPKGGTLLHLAVNRSDEPLVQLLLDKGASVNAQRSDRSTALHLAAHKGHEGIFRLLLSGGANVNVTMTGSKAGSTPLHLAAANGHLKIVEELLLQGADINAVAFSDTSLGGATALQMAVEKYQPEIVELLLEKGANVNATAFFDKTALLLAVEGCRLDIVKTILSCRPSLHDPSNECAYRLAITSPGENFAAITNMLTEYGFTVGPADVGEKDLLHGAIRKNQLEVVRMLLYHGTDVDEMNGNGFSALTPLHAAAQAGGEGVLRMLLTYGANVNALNGQGKTPIFEAVAFENLTAIKLFLAHNASIHDIPTYLITACQKGLEDIVKKLLERGADANVRNNQGETPLFICTKNARVVRHLLRYGARVDVTSNFNRTPLHEACAHGTAEVVEILLRNGADVESLCDMSRTPIFYATQRWEIGTLRILGRFNARIDHRDRERKTIFNHSATRGRSFTVPSEKPLETLLNYYLTSPHVVTLIQERQRVVPPLPPPVQHGFHLQNPQDFHQIVLTGRSHSLCILKLERHAFKMKGTGLFLVDKSLSEMSLYRRGFLEECRAEIEQMKAKTIGKTFVSFYDILVQDENQLARYARNESIVNALNSTICATFPIYEHHLKSQFEKGMLRKDFLSRCVPICDWMFSAHSPLPYEVKERILTYLSNKDLGHLIYTSRLKRVFS